MMIDKFDKELEAAAQRVRLRELDRVRRIRADVRKQMTQRLADGHCIACGCTDAPYEYHEGKMTYYLCETCEHA